MKKQFTSSFATGDFLQDIVKGSFIYLLDFLKICRKAVFNAIELTKLSMG